MSAIDIEHVTYSYSRKAVLKDITISFEAGEVVSLLGPNGSGKTTLLKLLLGIYKPQIGSVQLGNRPVHSVPPKQLARRIAYVPQVHRPSFGYRVLDVVLMGRMHHKPFFFRFTDADEQAALNALERLSIGHLKERSYTSISGGERQLVMIARALAQEAGIFIMDEPVNGLDYGNQIRMLSRIAELSGSGYTFIKTTHFPDHALWISDRVVLLKEGRVIADGATERVITKSNLYRLYNTHVDVLGLEGGTSICVPQAMKRFHKCSVERKPMKRNHMPAMMRTAG